ncbi:MAG: ATP-binding cassette domain-containing protein [Crocinitomicaceae bacterium]|nr:ATP-binding cassette domain-containing protein [Crocinitomicaceae bacterium]
MSERILKALMQLFAIIARIDANNESDAKENNNIHQIIRSFLKVELASNKIDQYLELFDKHVEDLRVRKKSKYGDVDKMTSVNSVKVLRICSDINKELANNQRFIVLVRLMELIMQNGEATRLELDFLQTITEVFKIDVKEYELIYSLLKNDILDYETPENTLVITGKKTDKPQHVYLKGLDKNIICIHIKSNDYIFFKYLGEQDLYLNGHILDNRKTHIFIQGSSVNTSKSERLYQVDIFNRFLSIDTEERFLFEAKNVKFKFRAGSFALHSFSFSIESGNLVGIMGGSGTGKSTLINILNGALKPSSGKVTINGVDIHKQPKDVEGIIGYVPQDDLLMEELTVYQNLFYSAKLSFGDLPDFEINRKVVEVLNELGLTSIRDLKVGSPLKKVISGGQRKRLNIALELIRKPAILFIDEPTSGLSSMGSLQIMNLLKALSLKGTLVIAVIHQPSSDVFKLFNRLIILDNGGYQVFDGQPIKALSYFKKALNYANADEEGCIECGNVNPEQIFEMIEAQIVNEFGIALKDRKSSPRKWHQLYLKDKELNDKEIDEYESFQHKKLPEPLKRPSKLDQFTTYFKRDLLSKILNRQYVLFILTEAPILAFIMSFFLKYYIETEHGREYIYYYNENISTYLFVSILVCIFLGMTVAAEEINKDKKNLQREKFLHLSWGSYLLSKTALLMIISGIQSFLFILVGHLVLNIKEQWLEYWIVLFSISVWSNILGLNISSAFRQTKMIYIIIPILIIPQMIFSGLIIRYDRMNPVLSDPIEVPWIGNVMISRWGYEALAVELASDNSFANMTFNTVRKSNVAQWKKDYWIPELHHLTEEGKHIELIKNEIKIEEEKWDNFKCNDCFTNNQLNKENIDKFLSVLQLQYTNNYNLANDSLDNFKRHFGVKEYNTYRELYNNENLEWLVTSRDRLTPLYINYKQNRILQLKNPIYQPCNGVRFLDSPYFIKDKAIFGFTIDTFIANVVVIWIYILFLYLALHYELLKRTFGLYKYISHLFFGKRIMKKPRK